MNLCRFDRAYVFQNSIQLFWNWYKTFNLVEDRFFGLLDPKYAASKRIVIENIHSSRSDLYILQTLRVLIYHAYCFCCQKSIKMKKDFYRILHHSNGIPWISCWYIRLIASVIEHINSIYLLLFQLFLAISIRNLCIWWFCLLIVIPIGIVHTNRQKSNSQHKRVNFFSSNME